MLRFFLCQKKYVRDILVKFGLESCKSVLTAVEERLKLSKVDSNPLVNPTHCKRIVGSLRYLTATRLDITFGVGLDSRFIEEPRNTHLQAIKRSLGISKVL